EAPPAEGSSLQGAVPIDLTFKAAGSYSEMMQFMSLVEGTVERKGSKLHTRGRLFNVVKLTIGDTEGETGGAASGGFGDQIESGSSLPVNKGDIVFTVVVRMYTSTTENSQDIGSSMMDDPAAAGTDPNAPAFADGTAPAPGADGAADPGAAQAESAGAAA
ncbi:MAG: hypothetical protein ABI200_02650, partial [Gaiellales bacterium]